MSGKLINAPDFFYFAAVMTVLSTLGSAIALLLVSLVPSLEGCAPLVPRVCGRDARALFESGGGARP